MDSFYASCEEVADVGLRGKPIAVCIFSRRGGDHGAVTTASYAARALGVKSGMPIVLAKRLAPTAVFLPANFELYRSRSAAIMERLRHHATAFEEVGIDEAFLEIDSDLKKAEELAKAIQKEIKEAEGLSCSIGIGQNKLVAKVASDFRKPGGITVVEKAEEFLAVLPVRKLIGVGGKAEALLAANGVETIGELAAIERPKLIEWFGTAKGVYLAEAARGIDNTPVAQEEATQISRLTTLPKDSADAEEIGPVLNELAVDVAAKVAVANISFKTVSIIAISPKLETRTRSKTIAPASDKETIVREATELLAEFLRENSTPLRRFGVRVAEFVPRIKTLFEF